MKFSASSFGSLTAVAVIAAALSTPASALSLQECSAKYSTAKSNGSLGSQSWNDFQRFQCSDAPAGKTAKVAPAAGAPATAAQATNALAESKKHKKVSAAMPSAEAPAPAATAAVTAPAGKLAAAASPSKIAVPKSVTGAASSAVSNAKFPKSISTAFAQESAGKARMHTCLEQYKSNKATNSNGGLEWIQKGGGFYSECNRRLKS